MKMLISRLTELQEEIEQQNKELKGEIKKLNGVHKLDHMCFVLTR